jgi:predicted PurR-regulated permease PerM
VPAASAGKTDAIGNELTQRRSSADTSRLFALIAGVVAVATLYFARAVLIPFALAMLLSFLLTPLVRVLEKLRLPRAPAVLLAVILAMAAAAFVAVKVTNQLVDVTAQLPIYRANFDSKVVSLHKGGNIGVLRATEQISDLSQEMVATFPGTARATQQNIRGSKSDKPVEVQVVKPSGGAWEALLTVLTPVGVAGVVLVFTVFILLRLEDLRNRFIRLVAHNHLSTMTLALDDASRRIGKYLLLQFVVNTLFGIIIGTGLHLIGLPNALLWGVIAAVCRFLPYVGAPIAAFMPIVLSVAVFPGWTRSLAIVGLYLVTEIVLANFVEPMLYGANTGISSLAILVAAVFWTLLWGPIGLVLSTPLTVCLVVLGRHVPDLEFLHVLLGDEPVLTPDMHFYQRMLASDLGEARQVLSAYLQEKSLQDLYESVVIPSLAMAQRDRNQDDLDEAAGDSISRKTRELVEEMNEEFVDSGTSQSPKSAVRNGTDARRARIVCVPTRTSADETIGIMIVQLLERRGELARCLPLASWEEMINQLLGYKPDVVLVSALQPFALTHARKLYSQIRARLPQTNTLVGLWNFNGAIEGVTARFGPQAEGLIVTNLAGAVEMLSDSSGERRVPQDHDAVASR